MYVDTVNMQQKQKRTDLQKVCQRKVHHPNGGVLETCQVYERKPEAHASDKFFMVKMFISFLKTLLHFKSYVIWSNISRNTDNTKDRNKRNRREENGNDALT